MMKTCIWCRQNSNKASFKKQAHTIPKSLGGIYVCENVCDECNHYFGSPNNGEIAIEVALKEILNFSRYYLLQNEIKYSRKLKRYKSTFFDVNWEKSAMKVKLQYRFNNNFQKRLAKQFRRGLYKVFLEERERQRGDALDPRYNFIREFARYNLLEYPIFYQIPAKQALFVSTHDIYTPTIRFSEHSDEVDKQYRLFQYPLIGHNFVIPTSQNFDLTLDNYKKHLVKSDNPFGTSIINIDTMGVVDFTFKFLDVK